MRKAGALVALIAGLYGTVVAFLTLIVVGGIGAAARFDDFAVWLGWSGVLFSLSAALLGAACLVSPSRRPARLLLVNTLAGAVLSLTPVAICMVAAFIGGVLAVRGEQRLPS